MSRGAVKEHRIPVILDLINSSAEFKELLLAQKEFAAGGLLMSGSISSANFCSVLWRISRDGGELMYY